jgi:hypothetical protein
VLFFGNWKGTLATNNKSLEIPVHLALQIVNEFGIYNFSEFAAALQEIEVAKMAAAEATSIE